MFSVAWKKSDFGQSGRTGAIRYKVGNNEPDFVCKIETWAFNSCACFALTKFNEAYQFKFNEENTDVFFKYIETLDDDWKPCEFYFMLSKSQLLNNRFKYLFQHPNVKLRDVFMNKSHGPNRVYLFRYSSKKDFKRIQLPQGVQ